MTTRSNVMIAINEKVPSWNTTQARATRPNGQKIDRDQTRAAQNGESIRLRLKCECAKLCVTTRWPR